MFEYMPNIVSVSSDVCFVKGPAVLAAVVVATPTVYIHVSSQYCTVVLITAYYIVTTTHYLVVIE